MRFLQSFIVTLSVLLMISGAMASDSKNILIIESYHAEYPWDASYIAGLKEVLKGHSLTTFEMGYVIFGKEQGIAAGTLALKMLEKDPSELIPPQLEKKGRFLFSKTQLEKWSLTLPGGIQNNADFSD